MKIHPFFEITFTCGCVCTHVQRWRSGTTRSLFSQSSMWLLGIKLRSPGLVARNLKHWASCLPALPKKILNTYLCQKENGLPPKCGSRVPLSLSFPLSFLPPSYLPSSPEAQEGRTIVSYNNQESGTLGAFKRWVTCTEAS